MANQDPQRSTSRGTNLINKKLQQNLSTSTTPKKENLYVRFEDRELDSITDLFENWNQDVDLRKEEILNWDQTNFKRWAITMFKPGIMSETVSGQELAKWYPIEHAEKQVKRLMKHPKDVMARLELVSLIVKSNRVFSTEVYRALLLQALVACSLGEFHINGLQIAIQAQNTYFSVLIGLCQNKIRKYQTILSDRRTDESDHEQQRTQMLKQIQALQKNMDIIRAYQRQTRKALHDNESSTTAHQERNLSTQIILRHQDLKALLIQEGTSLTEEKKQEVITNVKMAVHYLRYLPVLHATTNELIDIVIQLMPNNPTGYFLKARIAKSTLIFAVDRYGAGERTKNTQKQIRDAFNDALHQYGIAVDKIGKTANTSFEFTVLLEYANIIHYFFRISINILGITLPKKWLKLTFLKALKALELAKKSKKSDSFQRDLEKDWADAGFD